MTLLVTLYTSRGIVFAADSAITLASGPSPSRRPKQEKFLRTTRAGINGGVVGYFGLAQVRSEPMDKWLRRILDRWDGSPTIADLGAYLRDELNKSVPKAHRTNNASGLHIGGFELRSGSAVPVMEYVSNIRSLDEQTGLYGGFGEYASGEHFPAHPSGHGPCQNVEPSQIKRGLREFERGQGIPVWFRNGQLAFASRTWAGLMAAIGAITTTLGSAGFRLPDDLATWEALADTLVRTNGRLYALLNTRGAPTIEGPYRKTSISWPA
jgi:hypothetical protein